MQVTETQEDGLKRSFAVVVPATEFTGRVEARLTDLARQVRMPGFRPGKVPVKLMRQKYGESIKGEVLQEVVNETSRQVLDERGLRPALQPHIDVTEFEDAADLKYDMTVEILPEIDAPDLAAIKIERLAIEVAESEIDDAMGRVAEQHRSFEPVADGRAAAEGDMAVVDFVGKIDGEPFEGGSAEGISLHLGSGTFIPGFEDQLVGVKAGETRTVEVTFPEDYGAEHLAGKPATFEVKVTEVRQAVDAPIDDSLAQKMGMENLAALRDAVREQIDGEYRQASRAHLKRALLDKLAETADFQVPEGLADSEFEAIWKSVEEQKARGTLDEEDAGKSDEDLKAEYRTIAERRVRLGLLLSEIGRLNNIEVQEADINRALMNEARRFPGQEQKVIEFYQTNAQARSSLTGPLFEEKVFDFVIEMADITERKVSAEDFKAEIEVEAAAKTPAKKGAAKKGAAKKGAAKKSAGKKAAKKAPKK